VSPATLGCGVHSWLRFFKQPNIHFFLWPICAKLRAGITMPRKNLNEPKHKSKFADGFHISSDPVVQPNEEQEKLVSEFGDGVGLPRVHGASTLFAIARDPRTIFTYWSIDWPTVFAKTLPLDRQAHLRVYRADGIEEESMAVEPTSGNCSIAVSRLGGSYHVEIGYYQPADVWNSIARSEQLTMPPDSFGKLGDADLATIPFHLSFQRLLSLLGAANADSLAMVVSRFQTRALSREENKKLSDEEQKVLQKMDIRLTEIAGARRRFNETDTAELSKLADAVVDTGSTSPSRGFGSDWTLAGS